MQKKQSKLLSAILLALGSSGTAAYAQTEITGFSGSAKLNLSHDDNIYRTTDEFAQSDTLVSLSPEAKLVGAAGKHRFQVDYKGDYAKHFDLSDADYDDHSLSVRADLDHSLKLKTRFEAAYITDHQDPGTINRVQLDLAEFNTYDEKKYSAAVFYGGTDSTGRLELRYKNADIDYTNNGLDFLDNKINEFGAKFIYRISDKTKTYLEAIYTDNDYTPPVGTPEQDNVNEVYRAGITWNFANKLTGDVNAGYQKADFDNQSFRSTSGLTYDGTITWDVSSYTEINVIMRRRALDSTLEQFGSFTRNTLGTSIKHEFTDRLTFNGAFSYYKDDLNLGTVRDDKRYTYEAGLAYEFMPRITLAGAYKHQTRDSTLAFAEYESNVVSLSVKVAI
ncbi:outer membrane beta-barrel protein [Aestuariibacter sp. A3R04]|uniref:outer membrane beta-barrel protein n=1 Tax=Aestuariibacter sp. A3R04 TaxID=2841571 RepID=UPI001C08BADC|nr:outer membrane beta-barrel protein [Aestuariibacter sp. A3R04]MBU3023743.1 outer membrane beta-barrel protein [Aestuariibacter sp. A3R04]